MRLATASRFAVTLILATSTASVARAQSNPNLPRAEAYTYTAVNGAGPTTTCPYVQSVGATASSNVSANATCAPGAPYGGGNNTSQATGDITNGYLSASSSIKGVLNPLTDVQTQGLAYAWNYYTISDPSSVFRIVLSTSVNGGASATANSQDYSYALGYLGTYSVNASGGYPQASLSQQQRQNGAGGYSSYQTLTSGCDRSGSCTQVVTASSALSTDLLGSDLNSNGVFAAFLEAYAFNRSYDNTSVPIDVADGSYAYMDALTVTLYDASGADITSQHEITSDFVSPTVATPEPASIVFLGTGLISVFGIASRRRKGKR